MQYLWGNKFWEKNMRYIKIILCIITLSMFIVGCKNIQETSADAVVYYDWVVENKSGIYSRLSFNIEDSTARLIVSDSSKEINISGVFAVDSKCIYINSQELSKSFKFEYEVFENSLELKYHNEMLVFEKIKPQ